MLSKKILVDVLLLGGECVEKIDCELLRRLFTFGLWFRLCFASGG